ncbi:hypothetical protein TRVA0_017S02190 [Trichomonascus vanleenenianus]|uniref:ubiquitin-protein ligase peroxin 2 n=1 Tax=Trichomonascus vanleenenianus TaxID=2268995 RepID=UPI003ECB9791
MLKNQLWAAFKTFKPEIKDRYEPELLLLLKLALFKLTVWDHSATYGAKLQNLKFVDARSRIPNRSISAAQKLGYGIIVVGGSYLWTKLDDYLARASYSSDPGRSGIIEKLRKLTDALTTAWSVSTLANFVLFLYSGRYSTLVLRLLRIRLATTSRQVSRQVNFEFQNRQLVWNALTEFLLFILPLVNLAKIKKNLGKLVSGSSSSKPTKGISSGGELAFLPEKTCAICYKADASNTQVTNPYVTDCGHVYCYICLKSELAQQDEEWTCLRCTSAVNSIHVFEDIDKSAIVSEPSEKPSTPQDNSASEEEEEDTESDEDDDEEETRQSGSGFVIEDDDF